MKPPGRPERMHRIRLVGRLEMGARSRQSFAEPGQQRAWPPPPGLARDLQRHGSRPELAAEQRKQERRVGAHAIHLSREGGAVAAGAGVESGDVARSVAREQQMRTVGAKHPGRQIAVSDGEAARLQVLSDRAVGGRGQEQDQRRRHHVMNEARRGDFLAAQATADALVALDHDDLPTLLGQNAGGDQSVDAGADDEIVAIRHFQPFVDAVDDRVAPALPKPWR
jgi:hypothetical protein